MANIVSLFLSPPSGTPPDPPPDSNALGIAKGINGEPTMVQPCGDIKIPVQQGDTIQWLLSSEQKGLFPTEPTPVITYFINQYNTIHSIFSTLPTNDKNGWYAVFNEKCPTGGYRVQINWSYNNKEYFWASINFEVGAAVNPGPRANLTQFFLSFDETPNQAQIANGINGKLETMRVKHDPTVSFPVAPGMVEFLFSDKTTVIPKIVFKPGSIVPTGDNNGWTYTAGAAPTLDVSLVDYEPPHGFPCTTGHATIRINAS